MLFLVDSSRVLRRPFANEPRSTKVEIFSIIAREDNPNLLTYAGTSNVPPRGAINT